MAEAKKGPMHELLTAYNNVMKAVGYVKKGSRNDFHKYSYASEGELLNVLRPAMVENGLILVPSLANDPHIDEYGNTHLVMEYTLMHVSGEQWPEKIRIPGCGNDRNTKGGVGDKGAYKAMTGANKYALFKLFQIATGDDPEVAGTGDDAGPLERKNGNGTPKPTPKREASTEDKVKAKARRIVTMVDAAESVEGLNELMDGIEPELVDIKQASEKAHGYVMERVRAKYDAMQKEAAE